MTVDERLDDFERWTRIGLGRALQWIDEHGDEEHREFLSEICLVETAHDTQSEGTRAAYIHELLSRTPEPRYYRVRVLEAARAVTENGRDNRFLLSMAWQYAAEGDGEFRDLLYGKAVGRAPAWEFAVEQIASLDGIPGLVRIGRERTETLPHHDPDWLRWILESSHGGEAAVVELKKARESCPGLDALCTVTKECPAVRRFQVGRGTAWEELRTHLSDPQVARGYQMRIWARGADEAELSLAAEELLSCLGDDPWRILRLLQIFSDAAFPGPIDRLLGWARDIRPYPEMPDDVESPDSIVHWAAQALVRNERPEVRALGLDLIDRGLRLDVAAKCLRSNFEDGDWEILADLARRDLDPDEYHWLTMTIDSTSGDCEEPEPEAIPALLAAYERNPCSFCREMLVRSLDAADAVPDWMREECRDDACEELRDWAETGTWKE